MHGGHRPQLEQIVYFYIKIIPLKTLLLSIILSVFVIKAEAEGVASYKFSFRDSDTRQHLDSITVSIKGEGKFQLDTFFATVPKTISLPIPKDNICFVSISRKGYRKIIENIHFLQEDNTVFTFNLKKKGLHIKGKIMETRIDAPLSGIKFQIINVEKNITMQCYSNINGEYYFSGEPNTKYIMVLNIANIGKYQSDKKFQFTTDANGNKDYIKDFKIDLKEDDYTSLRSNQISKINDNTFLGKAMD